MRREKKKLRIRRILILAIIIGLIIFAFNHKNNMVEDEGSANTAKGEETKVEVKDDTINIAVIGDIMCHNTQFQDAYDRGTDSYDFTYVLEDVVEYLEKPDLTIGNLETTLAGKTIGYSGYPTFNTPEALAQNLKDLGVDILSTVNNHCMDKGIKGLKSTIDELDKWGFYHTGTFKTKEDSEKPLIVEKNGIKFGIVAYTYGTNGITVPSDYSFSVNLIDKDKMARDIERVKKENVDVIIAIMHWGIEYQTEPNAEQKDLADFLFDHGVDIVLGGHPHVLQTMEKREIELDDGTKKDGFIVYSLGNFISGQVKTYTKQSVILNIGLTKHNNSDAEKKITIDDVSYVPVYMYDSKASSKRYKLLDIRKNMKAYEDGESSISKGLYNTLQSEVEHIYWIMGDEIHKDF